MKRLKALLVVYGEGGHAAEMRRLIENLPGLNSSGLAKVAFTEGKAPSVASFEEHVMCLPLRDKAKGIVVSQAFKAIWLNTRVFWALNRRWDIRLMITTGPGIAVLAALLGRILGIRVLHVETQCRFYSKSMSGRLMYYLSDHFYVQNKELLQLYPKAIWCGRL